MATVMSSSLPGQDDVVNVPLTSHSGGSLDALPSMPHGVDASGEPGVSSSLT